MSTTTEFATLDSLESALGAELVTNLLEGFISETDTSLEVLAKAAASGDSDTFGKEAHRIKGACRNLGFGDLGDQCHDLEALGKTGAVDARAIVTLASTYRELVTSLNETHWRKK